MKLHGTIDDNLAMAIASARRLQGHPVHPDTLKFWEEMTAHARTVLRHADPRKRHAIAGQIAALETYIAERKTP